MAKRVLFSTSKCSWCRRAKCYLKEQGVPFKEINIERDQQAARDIVRKTGQTGRAGDQDREQLDRGLRWGTY